MYISEIHANGFRCFGPSTPLTLSLRRGLNVIVGPNDAGKTAAIDVIRHILWTRGDDFLRLESTDFHVGNDGTRVRTLTLRCTLDDLTEDEEAQFLEWCTNEGGRLRLHICLRASLRRQAGGGESVIGQYRAGANGEGLPLEGELREYLKTAYLKPLRDAERELRSGRRSRLSRILGALPLIAEQAEASGEDSPATLRDAMSQADSTVENHGSIQAVQGLVNNSYLSEVSFAGDMLSATLGLGAQGSFDQLLERLELYLNPPPGQAERRTRGLGYNNILFMAAELLLLQTHHDQVPFLLIEEPEAHLHPQHQTLFMQMLESRASPPDNADETDEAENDASPKLQQVQILLTTHSPHLAAGVDLGAMVMVMGGKAYRMDRGLTRLEEDDYEFLRRFLDATKANLFFAKGVLVVEGDGENLLLPAIAKKIGKPFGKHGVSIVKVGHRGLFRYSRIFQRTDGQVLPVPIALIPDRDIPPDCAKPILKKGRKTQSDFTEEQLTTKAAALTKHDGDAVKSFPSPQWTLEYDFALKDEGASLLNQAIEAALGTVDDGDPDDDDAEAPAPESADAPTQEEKALAVFSALDRKRLSKTVIAERLAAIIEDLPDDAEQFRAKLPDYLVRAIDYVTSPPSTGDQPVDEGGPAR